MLNHLSRPNLRKHGLIIQGEVMAKGEHVSYMIVEPPDESSLRDYMAPFAVAGSPDIDGASTCAG